MKVLPELTSKILEFREEEDSDEEGDEEGDDLDEFDEYLYADYGLKYKCPMDNIDEIHQLS